MKFNEEIIPNEITKIFCSFRKCLIQVDEYDRDELIRKLYKEHFFESITRFFASTFSEESELLQELIWILILVFSSMDEDLKYEILKPTGLLGHLETTLFNEGISVFSNSVWALGNLMIYDSEIKAIFLERNIFDKIFLRLKHFEKQIKNITPEFYQAFLVFLEALLITSPLNKEDEDFYEKLNWCLELLIYCNEGILSVIESDLLGCIKNITHMMTPQSLQKLLKSPIFEPFLICLFKKFTNPTFPYHKLIIEILLNLTWNLKDEYIDFFQDSSIQMMFSSFLSKDENLLETLSLIGNIFNDQNVVESIFFNKTECLFEEILICFKQIVEEGEQPRLIEEIVRVVNKMLKFKKNQEMVIFCVNQYGKIILYF